MLGDLSRKKLRLVWKASGPGRNCGWEGEEEACGRGRRVGGESCGRVGVGGGRRVGEGGRRVGGGNVGQGVCVFLKQNKKAEVIIGPAEPVCTGRVPPVGPAEPVCTGRVPPVPGT